MKIQRLAVAITMLNLFLLLAFLVQGRPMLAQGGLSVLRGSALEIVDQRGQVRARINVEPATTMPDGKTYPEAVVLRLTEPNGRIRVKLGADQDGAGLVLADDSQQPGVHLLAKGTGSFAKVRNKDGRETVINPH